MDDIAQVLTCIPFDGASIATVLFIISVELSVTLRLMGLIELAHGVFAMTGGYVPVTLINETGLSFFPAFLVAARAGGLLSIPSARMSAEADRQETRI